MITRHTRVSDALASRPELRRILPAFHPAFERLNHPVLGRVLPRLVTVADAARIAGVDADALVAVMNLPEGGRPVEATPAARPEPTPRPDWAAGPARELDVRPVLAANEDPLRTILSALRELPQGWNLVVIAPFEPVPLLGLLVRQGWRSWVSWEGDACRATFGRGAAAPVAVGFQPAAAPRLVRRDTAWELDVHDLEPPEPMRLALQAIDDGKLPLELLHRREPALLFPHLQERGLRWMVVPEAGLVRIHIRAS